MKALTSESARKWCETQGVIFPERLSQDGRFRPSAPKQDLPNHFQIKKDAGARLAACKALFIPIRGTQILIWYDDWGVWPSGEWRPMFERFRQAFGITESLIDRPAYLFGADEYDDALSFFAFAALFLWDCHVVNDRNGYCLFISHNEYGLSKLTRGSFE